jgi:uncharacterized hydrophobic protein (TIGR00271 family)
MRGDSGSRDRIGFSQALSFREAAVRGLSIVLVALALALLGAFSTAAGSFAPTALLLAAALAATNGLGYSELSLRVTRPGGAYSLVRSARGGGWLSFLTGWALALSGVGLCALLAQAAGRQAALLFQSLVHQPASEGLLAMAVAAIVVLSAGVWAPGRRRLSFFMPLVFLVVVALVLVAAPKLAPAEELPVQPDYGPIVALLLAAFVGMEEIAGHQSEIRRRVVNLPRLLIVVPIVAGGLAALLAQVLGPHRAVVPGAPLVPLGEAAAGAAGRLAVLALSFLALAVALRRAAALVVRHLFVMGRDGLWPEWFQHVHPRRRLPVRLALLLGLLVLPVLWLPTPLLGGTTGLLYLAALVGVNLALVLQPAAPGSNGPTGTVRPPFRLPFHPWVPALTLAIDLLAMLVAGFGPIASTLVCLALGSALFAVYWRGRLVEAQEGITVFRRAGEQPAKAGFRVLVPVADPASSGDILHMAGRLAESRGGEALALHVVVVAEPVPLEAGRLRAAAEQAPLEQAVAEAQESGLPVHAVTRVARTISRGILDAAVDEAADLILLDWQRPRRARTVSPGPTISEVMQDAPCDVVALSAAGSGSARSLLVPTAGGPHARLAAQVAIWLAQALQGRVTLLYVQSGPATDQQMEENRRRLAATLEGLEGADAVDRQVVSAHGVLEGLIREGRKHDLVLVGVSRESLFDRIVFGSVPLQLAAQLPHVGLVQKYQGLTGIWLRYALRTLGGWLPTLGRDEQLEVRQMLSRDSRPGVDYFVLIVLSCLIAALGLLLDSPAVVIGAMLVAPLMSPIMGSAVGLVVGDLRLIRVAVEAVFKGATLAALVAAFVGVASPLKAVTGEMLARSQPTLLDLGVALASGMAGAYAVARKEVSAALPGVAIAAALMPPLATVGLGFSLGELRVAGGALLLFAANVAAIVLAAGLVFFFLGIRPRSWGEDSRRQLQHRLIAMGLALLAIAVPLALIMAGVVRDASLERDARRMLTLQLAEADGELVSVEIEHSAGEALVVVTARAADAFSQEDIDRLAAALSADMELTVRLEMVVLPILRSAPAPGP